MASGPRSPNGKTCARACKTTSSASNPNARTTAQVVLARVSATMPDPTAAGCRQRDRLDVAVVLLKALVGHELPAVELGSSARRWVDRGHAQLSELVGAGSIGASDSLSRHRITIVLRCRVSVRSVGATCVASAAAIRS
jgi:hypothetical protein